MGPIKTYEITVRGFPPGLYVARSPAKARWNCYGDYCAAFDNTSFKDFLKISSLRTVPNVAPTGERVLVSGVPATRVAYPGNSNYVAFMWDDRDGIFFSHPLDVKPFQQAA